MVRHVNVLAKMSSGDEAMLLCDLDAEPLGSLGVVEQFTVAEGVIARLRQIHDTAPVRAAGLASSGAQADTDWTFAAETDAPFPAHRRVPRCASAMNVLTARRCGGGAAEHGSESS